MIKDLSMSQDISKVKLTCILIIIINNNNKFIYSPISHKVQWTVQE